MKTRVSVRGDTAFGYSKNESTSDSLEHFHIILIYVYALLVGEHVQVADMPQAYLNAKNTGIRAGPS